PASTAAPTRYTEAPGAGSGRRSVPCRSRHTVGAMRAASSIDELFAAPIGAYLVGGTWLYFCARADLFGFLLWGTPTLEDMQRLCRALEVELGDGITAHSSLVDVSRVDAVDAEAFGVLHAYVREHAA